MKNTSGTFLLGVGAQKCGTSWLHHYLSRSPGFDGGMTKEYHVWDALDLPLMRGQRAAPNPDGHNRDCLQALRRRMQTEDGAYFGYFRALCRDGATLTADITPAYAGLGRARLAQIKAGIEATGLTCKAIFLIRDPVERDKSAVRFNLARGNHREGIPPGVTGFCAALAAYSRSDHARLRSTYGPTLRNLRAVFGPEQLYIGVFEALFTAPSISALSEFLGVPPRPDLAATRINQTMGPQVDCPRLEREMRDRYRAVYEDCAKLVPETRRYWPAASST